MKKILSYSCLIIVAFGALLFSENAKAQDCEWRLGKATYSNVDPDGAGPAVGSATFTLQLRSLNGPIPQVTASSNGWSYQSSKLMVPNNPGCAILNQPANVAISAEFAAEGYFYSLVNQCGNVSPAQQCGGQALDKRVAGTLETNGNGITLTTTFVDVYTVTMWTLSSSYPEGGYVAINSGFGGLPAGFGTYAVSGLFGEDYITNSLTFTNPLPLGSVVPVLFSQFNARCNDLGTLLTWTTAQESNSKYFEIEKSSNGSTWTALNRVNAAGNSNISKNYQYTDVNGGTAFYRIKQVDNDGAYFYTSVTPTNCETKTITHVIYPVPAKDILYVSINSVKAVKTKLQIYDAAGKIVRSMEALVNKGNNTFNINLKGLASGDYIITSTDGEINLKKRFIISN